MSKGQGISINVIIIAAIALIILVILATLVIRSGGLLNKGTSCSSTGGSCQSLDASGKCPDSSQIADSAASGCGKDPLTQIQEVCCRPLTP